jgi:hypothetical protein
MAFITNYPTHCQLLLLLRQETTQTKSEQHHRQHLKVH